MPKINKWIVFISLFAVDFFTKFLAPTDNWTYHPFDRYSGFGLIGLIPVLLIILLFFYIDNFFVTMMFSGAMGNMFWGIFTGGNPNPLIGEFGNRIIAYNIADMCLLISIVPVSFVVTVIIHNFVIDAKTNTFSKKNSEDNYVP